jgi:putative FmdB family regulatory protein
MPVYEYICNECKKKFSWLVGVTADEEKPSCPRCGSKKYKKLISRVFRGRSEDAVMEDLAEEDFGDLEDPQQARQVAKKLGKEFGDELGDDFQDEVEAAVDGDGGEAAGEEDWD